MGKGKCDPPIATGCVILFNIFAWIISAGLLGLGLWTLIDPHTVNRTSEFLVQIDGMEFDYSSASYTAAVAFSVGGVLLIAAFCGCCGAMKGNKSLLGCFIFLLVILFLFMILSIASINLFRTSALDASQSESRKFVKERYMNDDYDDYSFNYIQHVWECCGVDGAQDYVYSAYYNATFNGQASGLTAVSPFCCRMGDIYEFREKSWYIKDAAKCQTEARVCQTGTCGSVAELYHEGCGDAIDTTIRLAFYIVLGFSVAMAVLVALGITCAGCLCTTLRRNGKPQDRYS